jgi:hypothetical protein
LGSSTAQTKPLGKSSKAIAATANLIVSLVKALDPCGVNRWIRREVLRGGAVDGRAGLNAAAKKLLNL